MSEEKQEKTGASSGLIVLIIVLVVIVLGALGAGGYVYYRYAKEKDESESLRTELKVFKASPTPTPSPTSVSPTTTPTATPVAACSKTGAMPTNGYVISDSSSRVISTAEIKSLTPWQLKVARNEIYARHGRPFVHKDLSCYFANQNWYIANLNYSEGLLSVVENKNVATILDFEKATGQFCSGEDSGC